jgi:hypothetical protein
MPEMREGRKFAGGYLRRMRLRRVGSLEQPSRSIVPWDLASVNWCTIERWNWNSNWGGISFASEIETEVRYRGVIVGRHRLDLVASGGIVVELKAVQSLDAVHSSQIRSYLKATHLSIGLLLNFASTRLVIKRVVLNEASLRLPADLPSLPAFPRLLVQCAESDLLDASQG